MKIFNNYTEYNLTIIFIIIFVCFIGFRNYLCQNNINVYALQVSRVLRMMLERAPLELSNRCCTTLNTSAPSGEMFSRQMSTAAESVCCFYCGFPLCNFVVFIQFLLATLKSQEWEVLFFKNRDNLEAYFQKGQFMEFENYTGAPMNYMNKIQIGIGNNILGK